MNDTTKGPVLPRGLSSSPSVYLAPVINMDGFYQVGLRDGAAVSHFTVSRVALEDWRSGLRDELASSLTNQLVELDQFRATFSGDKIPEIMGILNITPDSFSDGGIFFDPDIAVRHASQMVADGAKILDIGGESTRPGADPVSDAEEIDRVVPVIEAVRDLGVSISIDTRKKAVMAAAVEAGATLINDVTALEYDPQSMQFAAESGLPVCLMHSSADPKVMQDNPTYDHVVFDVYDYLKDRITACEKAGISKHNIIIDPGIGFGKTVAHNLQLIKGLSFFHSLGCKVLLGASRKSFIGKITGENTAGNRVSGSVAVALYGADAGVQIVRVHDVTETHQGFQMLQSIRTASF